MSDETRRLIRENAAAGVTPQQIVKALRGRWTLGAVRRVIAEGAADEQAAPEPVAEPVAGRRAAPAFEDAALPPAPTAMTRLASAARARRVQLALDAATWDGLVAIAAEGGFASVEACVASMLAELVADDRLAHAAEAA